jgi:FkbM family methyltransferase
MLSLLKKTLPRFVRRFIWSILFSRPIVKFENIIFKTKKLYDIKLPENANIFIDDFTKSLLRRNLYERCELKALNILNFTDNDFIDIGSSLGYIASKVSITTTNKKIILVEPDIELLRFTESLFQSQKQNTFKYYNNAIYYGTENIFLESEGNSLEKKISIENTNSSQIIPISLGKIINQNNIRKYNLLIDAEGHSLDPLFYEKEAFEYCEKLIIDEEFSSIYTKERVLKKLEELNFSVVFFEKCWNSFVIGAKKNKNV